MPTKPSVPSRHLTKSRFKTGLECPTKLYYSALPAYVDNRSTDTFMAALAEGGYQVGELAKCYQPAGIDIETLDTQSAVAQTYKELQADSVTLFEPAIEYENLLIRIDLLVKTGKHFDLYEVKAKSIDPAYPNFMKKNNNGLIGEWEPYLIDVAFQKFVLKSAFPDHTIACHLQLVNKTQVAQTDGLNSKFKIVRQNNGRFFVSVDPTISKADLATPLLVSMNVDDAVHWIHTKAKYDGRSFEEQIKHLDQIVQKGTREQGALGKHCRACQFSASDKERQDGLLSGYRECWETVRQWKNEDFLKPTAFDIWNLRSADKLMAKDKLDLNTLTTDDIPVKSSDTPGLTTSERQWMQINKVRNNDNSPYLDREGLAAEMNRWTYPLHFIDFETAAPAIPFTRNLKPYETVAFQFSHHELHENGRVEHSGEFLESTPGLLPSLAFLRALKNELKHDNGTVFRFHNHENTVLLGLARQLQENPLTNPAETGELLTFINSLTQTSGTDARVGNRNMVDLHRLNLLYFYHPLTGGSNSLKALLPAVLQTSTFLQDKYSAPTYGSDRGIPSLNFTNKQWVAVEQGVVQDPYASLPPLFEGEEQLSEAHLSDAQKIADGGAAMAAYAHLQQIDMQSNERIALTEGLLRYCELDTLAMVMVVEAWQDMLRH